MFSWEWIWWGALITYAVLSYPFWYWAATHDARLHGRRWPNLDDLTPAFVMAPLFAPLVLFGVMAVELRKRSERGDDG